MRIILSTLAFAVTWTSILHAEPPVASYIFPPGGQRGATVEVKVGGLFLHSSCNFNMPGPGIEAAPKLPRAHTTWFEGPVLPLPDSQRAEDYPKDMAGRIKINAAAPLGVRHWRLWTSQGATPSKAFVIGELPEIVEDEIPGSPVSNLVKLPVTINGRIFPRADVDVWAFTAIKGQAITCEVTAARIGSPLEARLEVLDPQGRRIAENTSGSSADPTFGFVAPSEGTYQVRIHDVSFQGSQAHVYRLTLTAGPHVDRVFPLGGRRGTKTLFTLEGRNLPLGPQELVLPSTGESAWQHVEVNGQRSNPFLLDVDALPEYLESSSPPLPKGGPGGVEAVCNGRIAKPGEIDAWTFSASKGQTLELELRAGRLGSPLDGILTIVDASGKQLARAESGATQLDAVLRFTPPADGMYKVQVQDRFHSRGGAEYAYRLRIAPPAADFRLKLKNDALTLLRGGQAKLPVQVDRLGNFTEPIALTVEGLPKGVTASHPATITPKQAAFDIVLKADADVPIGGHRITVRGSAKLGDTTVQRFACEAAPVGYPENDSVLLGIGLPTPFKIKGVYEMRWAARGSYLQRTYKIERTGYDGPLEIMLADRQARHLQGVAGPTITVPAGASEFSYTVQLPPWMETGRTSRVCVMGVARIKDADGTIHEVSFSSTNQNEQMVAVVEPGKLALQVDQTSLAAVPKTTVMLPVRITRAVKLQGAVRVELVVPEHMRGLKADPVDVAADRQEGVLTIHFTEQLRGPFNMPLLVRGTLLEDGRPIIAEDQIEIVPLP